MNGLHFIFLNTNSYLQPLTLVDLKQIIERFRATLNTKKPLVIALPDGP